MLAYPTVCNCNIFLSFLLYTAHCRWIVLGTTEIGMQNTQAPSFSTHVLCPVKLNTAQNTITGIEADQYGTLPKDKSFLSRAQAYQTNLSSEPNTVIEGKITSCLKTRVELKIAVFSLAGQGKCGAPFCSSRSSYCFAKTSW